MEGATLRRLEIRSVIDRFLRKNSTQKYSAPYVDLNSYRMVRMYVYIQYLLWKVAKKIMEIIIWSSSRFAEKSLNTHT